MSAIGKEIHETNTIICYSCYLEQPNWETELPTCTIGFCLRPGEYPENSKYYKRHKESPYPAEPIGYYISWLKKMIHEYR
jgi:hypothetical protein